MAWIELHEELPQHPKTKKLARILCVPHVHALGNIVSHLTWALKHAEDGVIRYDAAEVADGALWDGDPDAFMQAMRTAGWHDETENGIEIHDWLEYAGRLIERRQANAERMRNARAKKCDARAQHVPARAGATVPNLTVPNQTILTTPLPPAGGEKETLEPEQPNGGPRRFDEFWKIYPRKKSKGAAIKAWVKLKPKDALIDQILAAVEAAKTGNDWRKENGQYIPWPASWLNARGWEDDIDTQEPQTNRPSEQNIFAISNWQTS